MKCDMVVLAAGAEPPKIARQLGCRIPIQPGKGYRSRCRGPSARPRIPMIFEESHVAATPWPSGFRIGSTMEFVGYDRSINPSPHRAVQTGRGRAPRRSRRPARSRKNGTAGGR